MRHLNAHGSDIRDLGEVAAGVLDAISAAIYGDTHAGAHALTDGDGILLVMRIPDGVEAATQLEPIQRMVGAAMQRRTGVQLRPAGVELELERRLAVFAFERVAAPPELGDEPLPFDQVRRTG